MTSDIRQWDLRWQVISGWHWVDVETLLSAVVQYRLVRCHLASVLLSFPQCTGDKRSSALSGAIVLDIFFKSTRFFLLSMELLANVICHVHYFQTHILIILSFPALPINLVQNPLSGKYFLLPNLEAKHDNITTCWTKIVPNLCGGKFRRTKLSLILLQHLVIWFYFIFMFFSPIFYVFCATKVVLGSDSSCW